jgi:hypothetical protein
VTRGSVTARLGGDHSGGLTETAMDTIYRLKFEDRRFDPIRDDDVCGVPVCVSRCSPSSVSTPTLRNAFTSGSTRLSLTPARSRSMAKECER